MFPHHVQELQVFHDAILMLSGYGQPVVGTYRNLLIPLQHLVTLKPLLMTLSRSGMMAWTLTLTRCSPTRSEPTICHMGDAPAAPGTDRGRTAITWRHWYRSPLPRYTMVGAVGESYFELHLYYMGVLGGLSLSLTLSHIAIWGSGC